MTKKNLLWRTLTRLIHDYPTFFYGPWGQRLILMALPFLPIHQRDFFLTSPKSPHKEILSHAILSPFFAGTFLGSALAFFLRRLYHVSFLSPLIPQNITLMETVFTFSFLAIWHVYLFAFTGWASGFLVTSFPTHRLPKGHYWLQRTTGVACWWGFFAWFLGGAFWLHGGLRTFYLTVVVLFFLGIFIKMHLLFQTFYQDIPKDLCLKRKHLWILMGGLGSVLGLFLTYKLAAVL